MKSSSPPPPPTGILYRVDGESLNTLIEKYEQSLSTNATERERLDKLKQEYFNLKSRLLTLPQKIEYDALVPLGRRALCPGKIIHTNEIMCLLGDNWFVECSANKAVEVVNHRIAKLDEQYEGLRKEKELLNNWKQEAERQLVETIGEGTVEIREDFDEEHEKHWREQHRENVRRYHQQLAKERAAQKEKPSMKDGELWSRLDELELQEDLEDYLEQEGVNEEKVANLIEQTPIAVVRSSESKEIKEKRNSESTESTPTPTLNKLPEPKTEKAPANPPPPPVKRRVKFSADNIIHDISDEPSYEKQDNYSNEEKSVNEAAGFTDDGTISSYPCFDPIIIRFRHTSLSEIEVNGDINASGTEEVDHKSQIVTSPGDIVKVFGPTSISAISNKPVPKSILKPYAPPLVTDKRSKKAQGKASTNKPSFELEDEDQDVETVSAISKVVTERVPVFTNLQQTQLNSSDNGESEETQVSKPVSLFKMRRQQSAAVAATSPE